MKILTRFIDATLKLQVNQSNSAVDEPRERKFLGFSFPSVAVGTTTADGPPGGQGSRPPGAPQNVACGLPALRSSEVVLKRRDGLQLPVRAMQLESQQRKVLLNPLEMHPRDHPFPAPAAQHFPPVTLHGSMDPLQCPEVPCNAVVRIVTAKHLIEVVRVFPDRQVPTTPDLVLQVHERAAKS